jgi:hypothetical protein
MEALKAGIGIPCGITYTYYAARRLPRGFPRLVAVIPVIGMYIILPWQVSTVHMKGFTSVTFMWIGSFRLLMLCFDVGPLATPWAQSNLFNFMAVAVFPVKLRIPNSENDSHTKSMKWKAVIKLTVEGCLLLAIIYMYSFTNRIPYSLILVLFGVYMFLAMDIGLLALAALANACLGVELEPQFNKPYLSSSLTDFWGRRWNLVVTDTLRSSVYDPILYICWKTHKQLEKKNGGKEQTEVGKKPPIWARAIAVLLTFVVSGLMHELIFCCITETRTPSWEVTAFFIFHGLCTSIEAGFRRGCLSPYIKLPRFIAIPMTFIVIYKTGLWLFFPPISRSGVDVKIMAEYNTFFHYLLTGKSL